MGIELKHKDVSDYGGVNRMLQSPEGRKKLGEIQKRYEIERLQPSDPRFEKVYGEKNRKQAERGEKERKEHIEKFNEEKLKRRG